MGLSTTLTERLGIAHPIVQAPMGGTAGGRLAAAVSDAGGLGLVGGGAGDRDWLDRELALAAAGTSKPWGVGFLCWSAAPSAVVHAMRWKPAVVLLSFGDPKPFVGAVREGGAALAVQVSDADEARRAVEVGADVIVAQGSEAGGHGAAAGRSTMAFVPLVVDLVAPIPVLAAGGIADGRGVAAALSLGAGGAMVGTRFHATEEALVDDGVRQAIVERSGADTTRGIVFDVARRSAWPRRWTGRALVDAALEPWVGREEELAGDAHALDAYRASSPRGPIWAGEAIDLIHEVQPAGEVVRRLVVEAETSLRAALGG